MSTVHLERSNSGEQVQFNLLSESPRSPSRTSITPTNSTTEETMDSVNVLCVHDGVLLKRVYSEYLNDLNTSGSLSLVEYDSGKKLCIEWKPNENILISDDSQDQEDWALVDTISHRNRTEADCKVFNTKPQESSAESSKRQVVRIRVDELYSIEVKQRRQMIRLIRIGGDGNMNTEFFFQHGNAETFLSSLHKSHVIDMTPSTRAKGQYPILPNETQKLKKTFAELDIAEIKSSPSGNDGWLPEKIMGLLASLPDYMAPYKTPPKDRPKTIAKARQNCSPASDSYQMIVKSECINISDCPSADTSSSGGQEIIDKVIPPLPDRKPILRGLPFCENQWLTLQTPDGRITDPDRVLEHVYRGGITPTLRQELWKYLLNYYQWNDSQVERIARRKQKLTEYYTMKAQWLSMTRIQEKNFSGFRSRKCQIEKDVMRTDRTLDYFAGEDNPNLCTLQGILMTYVMYNFDLGYVQGMSDLLAPILAVMENEVDAFWCFVGFMEIVVSNFDADQAGMKNQFSQLRDLLEIANPRLFKFMQSHDSDNMYVCFRWLLVWYKREFFNEDILKLWECLWTRKPCPNYHLIISIAILDQQTDTIIDNEYGFNEILKHVNELSGNIDLGKTLEIAEAIYYQLKDCKDLPNHIREIIGEPLVQIELKNESSEIVDDLEDYIPELTPEEQRRNQDWLEEACERSMFLQYM